MKAFKVLSLGLSITFERPFQGLERSFGGTLATDGTPGSSDTARPKGPLALAGALPYRAQGLKSGRAPERALPCTFGPDMKGLG